MTWLDDIFQTYRLSKNRWNLTPGYNDKDRSMELISLVKSKKESQAINLIENGVDTSCVDQVINISVWNVKTFIYQFIVSAVSNNRLLGLRYHVPLAENGNYTVKSMRVRNALLTFTFFTSGMLNAYASKWYRKLRTWALCYIMCLTK